MSEHDGGRQPPGDQRPAANNRFGRFNPTWIWVALLLVLLVNSATFASLGKATPTRVTIPYSPTFLNQVQRGNVVSIVSTGAAVQGTFHNAVRYPRHGTSSPTKLFATQLPAFVNDRALMRLLQSEGVVINAQAASSGSSVLVTLLLYLAPTALFVLLLVWMMRRAGGGGIGGMTGIGRSRAKRVEPSEQTVTFADVAGIDDAREELMELVDFLKDAEKYRRLGGRIPRGVLLTGPPGTGKTLLARALAGEARVPFFSISAAEFVEMFVGVGASRVRDLFQQAKAAAPAIVFIDELDAIGRSRAGSIGGFGGGHDEREQTLNQILTEMDGFDPSDGVIVISATNRPEVLDPALLRPGRFDRHVAVQPPDTKGRRQILAVHTRSVPLAADVDLGRLAASTPGMVGADLANVVNEAALATARRGADRVTMSDLQGALEKLVLGSERRITLSDRERRRTAYHEAGHAIVGMLTPGADPVRKVSIIPHGVALGVTLSAPDADRFSYDIGYLLGKIRIALAGRTAEELIFGDSTTGAQDDIKQATGIARNMVGLWGMSEAVGLVTVVSEDPQVPVYPNEVSPGTQSLVDTEVRRLIDTAHADAAELLSTHREELDALAAALLEHETLGQDEAYAAAGIAASASLPLEAPVLS